MNPSNYEIKNLASRQGIRLWQIAHFLGISEGTLTRKLRFPLKEEEQKKILNAITEIAKENNVAI